MTLPEAIAAIVGDVRYSLRALRRAKASTIVLLVSLAVGTGANAVLYSGMAGFLFRPPAGVADSGRLVTVATSQFNGATYGLSSYPDFLSLKAAPAFQSLAAFDDSTVNDVDLDGWPQRVRVVKATDNFFDVLGLASTGGAVDPADHRPRAAISYSLWQLSGAASDVIGRALRVGGREFVVAAVLPRGFRGLRLGRACDVWVPLDTTTRVGRGDRWLSIVGRLAGGEEIARARAQADSIANQLAERYPRTNRGTRANRNDPRRMTVDPYSRLEPSTRTQLILLATIVLGATALLLVGACVNTASLLAARSAARRRELAVKMALGASRRGLVRQALVESLLVAIGGVALGLLLAYWTSGALPSLLAPDDIEMLDTNLDLATVTIAIGASFVAGAIFAIGPARHALTTPDAEALRADAGGISTESGGTFLRSTIVIGQVALSTILLICAGVLGRALLVALNGSFGPVATGIAIARVKMPAADAGKVIRGIHFRADVLENIAKVPGVRSVSWVSVLPVQRNPTQRFEVETGPGLVEIADVETNVVSGGYFDGMRLPIVDGRGFTPDDSALADPVVIVNDVLALRYFGRQSRGRTLTAGDGTQYTVVGVALSRRYRTFQEAPQAMVYFPVSQHDQRVMHLMVRTADRADALLPLLRNRLLETDPGAEVLWTMTLEDHLAHALAIDRVMTTVVSACGLMALCLAIIGVYGVVADTVRRRTAEIGLRIALGAARHNVVGLVIGEGISLTAAGVLAGAGLAIVLARVLSTFVYGVPSLDAISVVMVLGTLVLVVLGGAFLPTWRALRISPTVALRAE
jgi:predicted permease